MKIIKLSRRHISDIAKIDFESEHEMDKKHNISVAKYKKIHATRFNEKKEIFFGYKDENVLKGYVTLIPYFPGHKHCEVYWLAVSKKYQGQGIGKKLMKFIECYAKKEGFRKVCLYTNKKMKKTRGFYEKIGYKYINEFSGYYGYKKNNTAVLYGKKL